MIGKKARIERHSDRKVKMTNEYLNCYSTLSVIKEMKIVMSIPKSETHAKT